MDLWVLKASESNKGQVDFFGISPASCASIKPCPSIDPERHNLQA
jgi:hypothetical protein